MAVCPNCGVENSPMNIACDVCKARLVGLTDARPTIKPNSWMFVSLAITLGLYLPCWVLELHPTTLMMAMFYGPLLASYFARDNVVFNAALGGLLAIVVVVALSVALHWEESRDLLLSLIGGKHDDNSSYSYERGTSSRVVVGLGIPLVLAAVFPTSLVGASVGELLSTWRRRRATERRVELGKPEAPRKLTDDEIAKVEL